MIQRIRKLFLQKEAIKNIVRKELNARYGGSLLGASWAIINPLLIMVAINFIFTEVMKINIKYFPLFVLAGILPWMSFSSSLFDATSSIVRNSQILNQFPICKEILPIAAVLVNYISLLLGLGVMLPVFAIYNPQILPFILILPFIILLQLIFTLGISLFLACLNVFFRDTAHLLEISLMFCFWLTPVFYSIDMVPGRFQWICELNPMAVYITMIRNIIFEAKMPQMHTAVFAVIMAFVSFSGGYALFLKYEDYFLKRI